MPNFFKKLTGAITIPEEDETLEKELDESTQEGGVGDNVPEEEKEEVETTLPEPEEEIEEIPFEQEYESKEEEDVEPQETENYTGNEEENATDSPNPYTIAQLAQATTKQAVKKSPLSKLKSFKKKKEKMEEKEAQVEPEGQLAIDVYETTSDIVIKSTIAGVNPADLDVGIEDNVVNIRGARHYEEKAKDVDYFYQECYWGTFSRSVILPVEVDGDKAQASLTNGVLTIRIPKIQKEKEKKIKVIG